MAYDYEKAKQLYQGMNREQQQQFVDQNKNDANFQRFMGDYMNEINGKSTTKSTTPTTTPQVDTNNAKTVSDNGMNGQNNQQNNTINQNTNQNQNNNQNQFDPNEKLDTQMFENPAKDKIEVKEGTAQQTGQPDYQLDSEARTKEITDNLNYYFQNNPDYFKDRSTYNTIFHYNERSDAQKALLDSYWKKKDMQDKTAIYTNGDSITQGLNDGNITTDMLDFMKGSPAYMEWQQKQQEKVDAMIANMAEIKDTMQRITDFQQIMEKLNIAQGDPYDLRQVWEDSKVKYGLDQAGREMDSTVSKLNSLAQQNEAIVRKYSNAGADTMGGAAANYARMQRALAPITSSYAEYAQLYSIQQTNYQTKMASATQEVSVVQAQAQEDQRIFNNRIAALGMAIQVDSYRTPEQQAQLQLQTAQIQNEMGLLNSAKQSDLQLYNTYRSAKLQNQLNSELTDLSVTDPNQLRANLNNVLSQYYSQYGDIIQRPQSQVIDDVLAYAQQHGISVAQALKENFLTPLQNKQEYKNAIKAKYFQQEKGYSKITLNGKDYLLKDGELVDMDFLDDPEVDVQEGLESFLAGVTKGEKYGWCGTFVNDYLQKLGLGRLVGDTVKEKTDLINVDDKYGVKVGDVAIFDYSGAPANSTGISENSRKYGHVAIVTDVDKASGTITIAESNFDGNKTVSTGRKVSIDNMYLAGFYSPSGDVNIKKNEQGYVEERIGAYDKYLKQGILPSDAKLKAMGGLEKFEAEAQAYKADRGISSTYSAEALKEVTDLRKEFDKQTEVKNYRDALTNYNKLVSSSNGTAAGDMSMIFAYMKMLDPGSVVREGEFATAQNAAGIPERIMNAYNKAIKGTRLSESQRQEFLDIAKKYMIDAANQYNSTLLQYQGYVTFGGPSDNIGEFAQIPGVYSTNGFQSMMGGGASDIDSLVDQWASMM